MKLEQLYLAEMTQSEADRLFRRVGWDGSVDSLKAFRRRAAMRMHRDRGGDEEKLKLINAAYDILTGKTRPQPEPQARPQQQRPWNWADSDWSYRNSRWNGRRHRSQAEQDAWERDFEDRGPPPWAWAGWSGGAPPQDRVSRENYTDVNYIKKRMWELSGKSTEQWNILGFDGNFFRGMTTVYGNPSIFAEMAKAMWMWQTKGGNPYRCRAVFAGRRNDRMKLYLIYLDDVIYDKNPIEFDLNNYYDEELGSDLYTQFSRKLPALLDEITTKHDAEQARRR